MLRHCFWKPPFCLWRGKNVHTKTREYRTARRICIARVPGWILTTRHSLTSLIACLSLCHCIFPILFLCHTIRFCVSASILYCLILSLYCSKTVTRGFRSHFSQAVEHLAAVLSTVSNCWKNCIVIGV